MLFGEDEFKAIAFVMRTRLLLTSFLQIILYIVFCKADRDHAQEINHILNTYEEVLVRKLRSRPAFCSTNLLLLNEGVRYGFILTLESYFPVISTLWWLIFIGRSKSKVLLPMKDHTRNRIHGLMARTLSWEARDMLGKAIA